MKLNKTDLELIKEYIDWYEIDEFDIYEVYYNKVLSFDYNGEKMEFVISSPFKSGMYYSD